MAERNVIPITTVEQMQLALDLRRAVFSEEQGIAPNIEVDPYDGDPAVVTGVRHVLVLQAGVAVATGRIVLSGAKEGEAHVGRVAVSAQHRGRGYGRAVMMALHEIARDLGLQEIVLGAEVDALGFYQSLGYVVEGEVYREIGVDQLDMRLVL